MELTKINVNELKAPEKNIRKHTQKQIDEYMRSIKMFGQIKPIICDENNVVWVGNGLLLALKQLGVEYADCYKISGMSETKKKKLMLADNKVYELGDTNIALLDEFLAELEGDFDIPGFDTELLEMIASPTDDIIDDSINSYGTFNDSEIDRLNKNSTVEIQENDTRTSVYNEAPTETPMTTQHDEPISETRKFVICPHCGEKIWL